MKALILAAGIGSRLAPLTDHCPKALVKVNGVPILKKQIENLIENNIKDIVVVSGYQHEKISSFINENYPFIKALIINEYNTTNNMYSAYKAMEFFYNSDFIMMNGDVFYDSSIIRDLLRNTSSNAIAVQNGVFYDESMKIVQKDGRILHISKTIAPDKAYGVSIDVYKFSAKGGTKFFDIAKEYIETFGEKKLWSEVALDMTLKYVRFGICNIKSNWLEIDNIEDLKQAESLFSLKG